MAETEIRKADTKINIKGTMAEAGNGKTDTKMNMEGTMAEAGNGKTDTKMNMEPENSNRFSESKNFIQSIADVSLMMANISQLRAVLGLGDTNKFYIHLLTLILLSLVSHIFFVFFTVRSHFKNKHNIVLKRSNRGELESEIVKRKNQDKKEDEKIKFANMEKEDKQIKFCCCCTKTYRPTEYTEDELCQCPNCIINLYLNYICSFFVLITICANIGITGIGISGDC